MCRQVLSYLPSNNVENPPYFPPSDDPLRMDEELNSIVPLDPALPYSMHEVIEHVVDQATRFSKFSRPGRATPSSAGRGSAGTASGSSRRSRASWPG